MNFTERLLNVQRQTNSLLCVGLDPDRTRIPAHLQSSPNPVLAFCAGVVEATHDLVCAYKPNLAFFEALGESGRQTLRATLKLIPRHIITIGDGKRGDIGNTSAAYARSLFDDLGFDSVTVNPYMGFDSIEPFMRNPERGVFVLALTSNPGSKDFQRLKTGTQRLYERVVKTTVKWNANGNLGLVVGATHPAELKRVRSIARELPLLIPGVGAQGGDLEATVKCGCTKNGDGAVINASRSILYASSGNDFAEAARREATTMQNAINAVREKLFSKR